MSEQDKILDNDHHLDRRIDAMFTNDKVWAYGFVIILWLSYAYVFFAVNSLNDDGGVTMVLMIGGGLVLLYNTASITAMIKHYAEDRKDIYGLDIQHLDEMRQDKRARHHIE